MARESKITFGQVATLADQMKAAGTRPTARAIRERIGSGSMGTIHRLLTQWRGKATEDDQDETPTLPDSIGNALMEFISTEIATATEPLLEELAQAKEDADALAEHNERLESDLSISSEMIRDIENENAELKGKWTAETQQNSRLRTEAEEHQRRMDDVLTELNRHAEWIRTLERFEKEAAMLKLEMNTIKDKANELEKENAVLKIRAENETEKATDLRARLDKAEAATSAAITEAKTANQHYTACAAHLEAAAREIETLKKKPTEKAPAAKRASSKPKATTGKVAATSLD